MPTPYGSRGGMAFSAEELRVLRRALAIALNPAPFRTDEPEESGEAPDGPAGFVRACLHLARSVDETAGEAGRLRAFLFADLARYRDALPGASRGYLGLLQEALDAGYEPCPEDLSALRSLPRTPLSIVLLEHCGEQAERSVHTHPADPVAPGAPAAPPLRTRLRALPGGRAAGDEQEPRPAEPKPAPGPAPRPDRPIPTPGEVFPPRRRPAPPPEKQAVG
ncbi:hypothetical protein [Streptomyces sp. NPDC059176]|uniref:hypothetical protein n=1 Tax=unclassified Streptomyces TaxID=2593676 RepID=UPI0036A9B718